MGGCWPAAATTTRCGRAAGSYPVICCASAVAGDDEPVWDVSPQLGRPVPARASRPGVSGCLGFGLALVTGLDHFPPANPLVSAPGRIRPCDRLLRSYPRPSAIATSENPGQQRAS